MHGCNSGSTLLVNAEVDSMGGVVDGGIGIGLKTSPRRAAIEKAQAELRQEYDVREERRRELEFLEKGGNPLDFKFGNAASVSVQSTSLTDQNPEQFVTSEAKGSFAASPHGDSVESSGRPGGPTVCEPSSADNLLLFDGDNDLPEAERNPLHPSRRKNNVAPSEQSSQNAKESEDSAIVRPYARRNRSRSNREGARSNSTEMGQGRSGLGSSLPFRSSLRDAKGVASETNNQKDQNMPSVCNLKSASSNGEVAPKVVVSDNQLDMDLDGAQLHKVSVRTSNGSTQDSKLDIVATRSSQDSQDNQPSQIDAQQIPSVIASGDLDVNEKDHMVSAGVEPCLATTNIKTEATFQPNGVNNLKSENKILVNEVKNPSTAGGTKGLDSESSCTQTSLGLDVHNDSDICTNKRNIDSNGNTMGQTLDVEGTPNPSGGEMEKEKNEDKAVDGGAVVIDNCSSLCQNHSGNVGTVKIEEDIPATRPESDNEIKHLSSINGVQKSDQIVSETDMKLDDKLDSNINVNKENRCVGRLQDPQDVSMHEIPEAALSGKDSAALVEPQACPDNDLKVVDKAHEDSILEEARTIEAKRKRIAELSVRSLPLEIRRKSHWDFVLEEMAWLANDFAQERLWRITAAAQLCHKAAFSSRLKFEEQHQQWKLKEVAHALSKAVLQFWHSAEVNLNGDGPIVCPGKVKNSVVSRNEVSKDKSQESNIMESSKELELQCARKNLAVQGYAVRFLKYNSSLGLSLQAEAPATPDRISDLGILDVSWEDILTEESLFYTVPPGAMESYRKSIESHLVQFERTGSSMQEEVETSMYDAAADYGFQENPYIEDEGETSTYYQGAFEVSKSSKSALKKRKNSIKSYTVRSYETGTDLPYGNCMTAAQQSMLLGKRPGSLNVGPALPKRMRTASRPRVLSPFGSASMGSVQVQMKTDASSGDTSSFQDDQSTLHGGSQFQKSVEVESVGDFDKQLPYDCAETSMKPKKKKKAKHPGSTYDQGWQVDSAMLNDQRDHSRKRLESHHFESNGTSGLYVQHSAKKPKMLKQPLENTFDNITSMTGSIPSPVASQNNISSTSKFIKLIGGRDRGGRKAKSVKTSVGQPGSGSPWSPFEDQALVVLVHDMGPNWELISDAINSILQFKCIFRNPKECKERHKILMDKSSGDGADSAEDSGSSQPYPSTLPGIPKGSARQLFQRLQEPMEEDTLKSHFDKIMKIGQKLHYRRSQNENQNPDPKQLAQVHNSHVIALSQVHPNNLNGVILTPLDLCDATTSSPDVLPVGYQGSHPSGLGISNQGAVASLLPSSGANSSMQGSSGLVHGGNVSSPSSSLNASIRDGRYSVPRASSLPVDEQQRLQQYNPMLSGRNIQQSSLSVPGGLSGADRGVRMLPGGNGMGMMCGMNRSMPISRPGFPGMTSSSMLSSGSMLSSSMSGIPSPVNMHSGAGSGQGNSMIRPREALHMMRPGHNAEHQRQVGVPELQMQVTQGNSQGIAPFNGLSAAFSNQTIPPQVQSYPNHSQQQHPVSPQQPHALSSPHHPHLQGPNHTTGTPQAYAMHLAKERMQRQRYMQHPQQFAASNAMMSHVQSQPHHPISSTLQNSSQIQSQTSSQPVSLSPLTPSSPLTPVSAQHQQKHNLPSHGLNRNPGVSSGLSNQMGKQRQRQAQNQHLQQTGRNHPQQRQHVQPQQQAKHMKGVGRGLVHQNLPVDPSHLNGLSVPPGNQSLEKGEQIMQMMQGQAVYSGSSLSPIQPSKSLVSQSSNHSQQKLISSSASPVSKLHQQMPSHSDNIAQGQAPSAPPGHQLSVSHQAVPTAVMASNHRQLQPQSQSHQKQVNQTQPSAQRTLQQNHQVNSEMPNKSQTDIAQADHSMNNSPQVGVSMAIPQSSIDAPAVVPVSSAIAPQWKPSDSSTAQAGSVGSPPPHTNAAGNEPTPPVSQGIGPRQLSGGLTSHGHNVGAQWQQQQQRPPLQQSPTMPPSSQQYVQKEPHQQHQEQKSPQQLPLQQQPSQQMQVLQTDQGSLYLRPTNSKPE